MLKAKVIYKDGNSYIRKTKNINYKFAVCAESIDGTHGIISYNTRIDLAEKSKKKYDFLLKDGRTKDIYIAEVIYI